MPQQGWIAQVFGSFSEDLSANLWVVEMAFVGQSFVAAEAHQMRTASGCGWLYLCLSIEQSKTHATWLGPFRVKVV